MMIKKSWLVCTLILAAGLAIAQAPNQDRGRPPPPPPGEDRPPGAPPPLVLSSAEQAKVKSVLSAYKPATLTAEDARALKRALRDAGLRRSPALDDALNAAGFSPAKMEALDPRPPGPPGPPPGPPGPPAGRPLGK
jgi:hypothetical protein